MGNLIQNESPEIALLYCIDEVVDDSNGGKR
jgi:hypothetical protein